MRRLLLALALFVLPREASAQEFSGRVREQQGLTLTRQDGADSNDYFVAVTPEVTTTVTHRTLQLAATYAFTGSIHSFFPSEIGNRLAVNGGFEADRTTQVIFNAEALQTSLRTYFLVQGAANNGVTQLPAPRSQLVSLSTTEGITHELSPVLRFSTTVSGQYVTSIDPDLKSDSYVAGTTFSLDRSFVVDALGLDARAQYARTDIPPLDAKVFTISLAPRWNHDFNKAFSSSLSAGGQIAFSPDKGTDPVIGPVARASILYKNETATAELSYIFGYEPNLLTATLLRSHQATLRGAIPIWERKRVLGSASVGILNGRTDDLKENGAPSITLVSFLGDAELSWGATDLLGVFARYTVADQTTGTSQVRTPPLLINSFVIGVDLFTRAPVRGGGETLPNKFPQRVDRSDGAPNQR